MKVAVLADIHGNADALAAVMTDIAAEAPDLTVNLGDCFSGPLEAEQVGDLLLGGKYPTVRGNHDRALVELPPEKMGGWEAPAIARLQPEHMRWLEDLPKTRAIENEIFMCHATPQDDVTGWLDVFDESGRSGPASRDHVEGRAEGNEASLFLCGHTHVQRAVRISGDRMIVNPGSVGCPGFKSASGKYQLSVGSPHARYAIVEQVGGRWMPRFKLVPYDWDRAAAIAEAAGEPVWQRVLATGWVD